jgi:DNA helicase IV
VALNLFTQKDIERIDINEIPEEFINYFDDLNNNEKQRISELRPDLAAALGYKEASTQLVTDYQEDNDEEDEIISVRDSEDEVPNVDLSGISENIYDGKNLRELVKTELNPLELLTIRVGQEKCKIHRRPFEHLQISYLIPSDKRPGLMATYGITPRFCCDCNRLYVQEGRAAGIEEKLSLVNKTAHVYSLEETDAFIRSQMSEIKLSTDESIYVPDVWIEDNPVCPIHNERIEEYPYVILHGNKTVKFNAYFCEKCNKTMLRRTKALDLEDMCAEVGIPMPTIEQLIPKIKKKKQTPKRDLKPHYFVENGKRKDFAFENSYDFYLLDESDTVVVSDSIYCNLLEHDTDEVMVVFSVNQKRDGRKNYLCLAGYCAQCQKYYMSEDDYKVIYPLGRPEVTIISDLEGGDYQITSGEVFDLEKKHLADLESDLDKKTDEIYNADDYMNPYETIKGGYDEGGLHFGKARSEQKYGNSLEKWNGYKPKPYTYRVDLSCDGDNITYYLGPTDIQIDDDTRVISFNDRGFGAKLANYRTIEIEISGKTYKVKISRQFDIDNAQLYGYVNLRTDEDIIFRSGITDPFLIKVLNLRKKQHNLVDIIATIQENQNAIVDEKFRQNIVVQGCAGSGKTMVLLHRLSSLKYNNPEYDFGEALILTPNEQFSLHIKGLAEGLQIGFIRRLSVEEYYIQILRDYAISFVPQNAVSSEVFVNQAYVDYVYSDAFKADFDSAYEKVMQDRQDAFAMLRGLCEEFSEDYPTNFGNTDSEYLPVINHVIRRISLKVEAREKEINEAEELYKNTEKKLKDAQERIPKVEHLAEIAISEVIPKVYTKLGSYLSSLQHSIEEQQAIINNASEEASRVERQFFPFGKRDKLSELKKTSDKAERKIKSEQAKIEEAQPLLENKAVGKSEEEILDWVRKTMLIIPDVRDEIRFYERCKNELPELRSQISELEVEIVDQKNQYETVAGTRYSDDVKKALNYLTAKATEYSEFGTFTKVFEQAVAAFKEANKVKVNKGTHRYDLYAAILFCIKFYDKLLGTAHFICVDEGQDVSINEYRLIYLLNQRDVVFNVYGDVNQLLKPGRGISDWTELEKEFSMKEFQLNENYRNTNQITRFCNSSFEMDVMQTGVDGAKVREIPRRDLEKELAELKLGAEKVAVLVSRSVRRKNYLVMDILPADIRNAIGQKIDNGLISFMYVDEVKGIEFDKVFVVSNKMTKNEKYIAYTRALSELVIVVDENIVEQEAQEE